MSEFQERQRRARTDTAPILADLANAGFHFESLADLRKSGLRYRGAIPVLLRWLPRVADMVIKEDLVRALSVPWARPVAAPILVEEFRRVDPQNVSDFHGLLWAIGNALAIVGTDAIYDDLASIARDGQLGTTRQMVVLGLGRSKKPEAIRLLLSLLDDEEVSGHAVKALGKIKAPESRSGLEGMLNDKRPWVRKEARNSLSKLNG